LSRRVAPGGLEVRGPAQMGTTGELRRVHIMPCRRGTLPGGRRSRPRRSRFGVEDRGRLLERGGGGPVQVPVPVPMAMKKPNRRRLASAGRRPNRRIQNNSGLRQGPVRAFCGMIMESTDRCRRRRHDLVGQPLGPDLLDSSDFVYSAVGARSGVSEHRTPRFDSTQSALSPQA
jgi:hypothetical protein